MVETINHDRAVKTQAHSQKEIDRFRRLTGLGLGVLLALVFGLITQVMVRFEMPGVPLMQPPFGLTGNLLVLVFVGGVIGLLAGWPEEPIYGMVFSAAVASAFVTGWTLYTAGPIDPNTGTTVLTRIVSVVFLFLPIAGIIAPIMILLVWVIGRLTASYRGDVSFWKVGWLPLLLVAAMTLVALLVRLPVDARLELQRTHQLIQDGLAAPDRQSLPETLRTKLVGDFFTQASQDYTLAWDNQHVNRYGIPRPGNAAKEAVVVAHFASQNGISASQQSDGGGTAGEGDGPAGGWSLACLYSVPTSDPICKGIGEESGKAIFSSTAPNPFDVAWDDYSLFANDLVSDDPSVNAPLEGATVYHVEVTLPASGDMLKGKLEAHYTNQENVRLNEVYFRLFPNLGGGHTEVSGISVAGNPVGGASPAVLEQQNSALRVPLAEPLQPGESTTIAMDFSVQVPEEMAGNYGLLSHQQGIWALDAFLPTIAVYDQGNPYSVNGWMITPTPANGDNTFNDAAYYLVQVNAPSETQLVASGALVGGQTTGSTQNAVFAAGPARDFYLAASPQYVSSSERLGKTTITAYSLPEQSFANLYVRRTAADAIKSFNQRYGEYPYTELEVVGIPMEAQGIEYPGVIGLSLGLYDSSPGAGVSTDQQDRFRTTIAHEVAHQWFYNLVGNDQNNQPWLDEALAQYASYQYIIDTYGNGPTANGLLSYWEGCIRRTQTSDTPIGLPAGDYSSSNAYVGAVYCRGPLFIQALRDQMGSDKFDTFMKDYVAQNRWGIATENGFRQLAEKECNCDLGPLFAEWVDPTN